jgi:hypothetical protein
MNTPRALIWSEALPALSLMVLAPLIAEVLPGATRFSAIFVLPIEICVWGGGAVMIRYAVRRWRLGWRNMLLLALALALAEELLIQQTSLAPLVIQLRGQVYARALGVNYLYLLWALAYETVFVVFVPIYLAELIFVSRRQGLWLSGTGLIVVAALFVPGSFLAWFSWTQVARPNVFHVPAYNPPLATVALAAVSIAALVFLALGPFRLSVAQPTRPLEPPAPWLFATAALIWAMLWYALVVLAFGIAPQFPPAIAVGGGVCLTIAIVLSVPRFTAHPQWSDRHQFATIFGAVLGSMLSGFVGFIGSLPLDLYFKIVVDAIAIALLIALGWRVERATSNQPNS